MVAFQLPPGTPPSRGVRFQHKFWGRTTKTHGGKYTHTETGLMQRIPHHRLQRGLILLREQDIQVVEAFLREWGATSHTRRIQLTDEDHDAFHPKP